MLPSLWYDKIARCRRKKTRDSKLKPRTILDDYWDSQRWNNADEPFSREKIVSLEELGGTKGQNVIG